MRWMRKECWSDVETQSCGHAGDRRVAAAETDVSALLASLCGDRFGARPRLPDFDAVFAAADGYLSRHHGGGARFSCVTTPRIWPALARPDRCGDNSNRQVLF